MNTDPVWVLEDPDERPRVRKPAVASSPSRKPQKNPGVAFSLSLFVWGAGQIYNRQGKIGLLLMLLMANFYVDPLLIWVYPQSFAPFLEGITLTHSRLLMGWGVYYFAGLIVWLANAQHAYYVANTTRTEAFRGIDRTVLPAVCSLLVPGWGQFLNGQGVKGAIFLVAALSGFLGAPALLTIAFSWPTLAASPDRLFWEAALVAAVVLCSLSLLIWPLNAFDALKVSRDDTKKAPLLKRLEYAANRRRMYGWTRGVFPYGKRTLGLGLVLALCAGAAYYQFPRTYYLNLLHHLEGGLSRQQMVLIPRLIHRVVDEVLRPGEIPETTR